MLQEIKITNLKTYCESHKEEIIIISQNKKQEYMHLWCKQCLRENEEHLLTMIAFKQFLSTLIERRQQALKKLQDEKQQYFAKQNIIKTNLQNLKNFLNQKLIDVEKKLEKWEKELNEVETKYQTIDFMKEFQDSFQNNVEIEKSTEFQKINKSNIEKLILDLKQLYSTQLFRQCHESLNSFMQDQQQKYNNSICQPLVSDNPFQFPQKNTTCPFKISENQLICSCDKEIQIYELNEGKLQLKHELQGHGARVQCLVEKNNWIASGDLFGYIKTWVQKEESFLAQTSEKRHSIIDGLILDQKELISFGGVKIFVWQIDKESIQYKYEIISNQVDAVLSVSLNQSKQSLIASYENQKIYQWQKNSNQVWVFKNKFELDNVVQRICFITDFTILFLEKEKGNMSYHRLFEDNLQRICSNKLNDQKDETTQFPSIYNQEKRIIIQKHNKFIYVIKWQLDGKFVIKKTIDCGCSSFSGTLSDDGKLLALWNQKSQVLKIYRIDYQINQ